MQYPDMLRMERKLFRNSLSLCFSN